MTKEDLKDLTNQQYRFCCELIWGGIPFMYSKGSIAITKEDNIQCRIFQEMAPDILNKYPQLDKSFFEINI